MTSDWRLLFEATSSSDGVGSANVRLKRQAHRVHLVGIGGAGLAPIANVLLQLGFQVSGSDQKNSSRAADLAGAGAVVHIGHSAANLIAEASRQLPRTSPRPSAHTMLPHRPLPPSSGTGSAPQNTQPDLVLISSAVPLSNPEVQAAMAAGIPVVRRSEFLGPLTAGRRVIAVAGTHGKTTTTAMIAHMLVAAGQKPGYIIGSEVAELGHSAAGSGPAFVIEADEYDFAFLGLQPALIVLTSLEWDHPDCFPTPASYIDAFRRFVEQLEVGGQVIYCQDDAGLQALATDVGNHHWLSYGSRSAATWQARAIDIGPQGTAYTLHGHDGTQVMVRLGVHGLHNVLNSTGALLATRQAGVSLAEAALTLPSFRGAGRRFEVKGEAGGVLVIDDYGHHPTEIQTTLAAARAIYPEREIWAVYQPHTYSRTRALLDHFEGVFAAADHVLITDIFGAREAEDPSVTPALVVAASRHHHASASGDLAATAGVLQANLRPNSVVVILSAGTGTDLAPMLLAALGGPALDSSSEADPA